MTLLATVRFCFKTAFLLAALLLAAGAQAALSFVTTPPVGYDNPAIDQGGPVAAGGLEWIDKISPPALQLAPKLAGGKPTVVAFVNGFGVKNMYELNRRFPMDLTVIAPPECPMYQYGNAKLFAPFTELIKSGKRIDAFIISRVDMNTVPDEVLFAIVQRVRKDGAGLVVSDLIDWNETFNPGFLGIKQEASNPRLIPGIPYEGFTQWVSTQKSMFYSFIPWNTGGIINTHPAEIPYQFGSVWSAPYGKGRVIWIDTASGYQRYYGARVLAPDINQHPSMWTQNDYFYSHAAKSILLASGREQAITIKTITPAGIVSAGEKPVVEFSAAAAFTGKLRWELRDSWGEIQASGARTLAIPEKGGAVMLDDAQFKQAGKQYLDLWVENAAGETVDWGSSFVNVDRKVAAPAIALKYPQGTPRGENLQATVTAQNAPAGSSMRATLIDRYWRQVGTQTRPLLNGKAQIDLPCAGLSGQIWNLLVDITAPDGSMLARGSASITSPHTRQSNPGFYPRVVTYNGINPESNGQREYLRQVGFLAMHPFGAGSALEGEGWLFNDLQPATFPYNMMSATNGNPLANQGLADYNDPLSRREIAEGTKLLVNELRPFGIRGFTLTDDSSPSPELTVASYTTFLFHEWLQREYGDFDAICKAWGWTPQEEALSADQLPYDPYVTAEFHTWLTKKYGDFPGLSKAWNLSTSGYESLHVLGAIHRDNVAMIKASGKGKPDLMEADVKAFMKEYTAAGHARNPMGRITRSAISRAYGGGNAAPWIDAQRFMAKSWVDDMEWVQTSAREVIPDLAVGTDAAFYGCSLSDCFGRLTSIGPYYDDRAVKVAVSRGRARQDGDYGACVGTYGEKPPVMTGRRGMMWDLLFAGGNGLYYWTLSGGLGLNEDITPQDAHSQFQLEAIDEIMRGPGDLVTHSTRVFAPVAILDSSTSYLCDQLERRNDPITNKEVSIAAFQFAFEDAGLNPHTITADELAGGWLKNNGIKILALPGVISMSDGEIDAVREFVKSGGIVIADIFPGLRRSNSLPRAQFPLADVFGVESATTGVQRTIGKMTATLDGKAYTFGELLADPRVKAKGAIAAGSIGATPTCLGNDFGQGKAYLINAAFSSYNNTRVNGGEHWLAWSALLGKMAGQVKTQFPYTSAGKPTPGFEVSAFRNGNGYLLGVAELTCNDFTGARRPIEITLPGTFSVYDVRGGKFLGSVKRLVADVPRGGHRLYALMPYRVQGITLKADTQTVKAGDLIKLNINLSTSGPRDLHVLRVEACDPQGKLFFPHQNIIRLPKTGPLQLPLRTATNDMPGKWTFAVVDINSGARATCEVTVK